MRKLLFAVACVGLLALPVLAQNIPPQHLNWGNSDGELDSGWVVSIPAGSSDYFNSRYDSTNWAARRVAGVGLGSADFGSGTSYPMAGLFSANLGVDPSGNTPDLSSGFSAGSVPGGGVVYNWVYGSFGGSVTPGSNPQHVTCQFPPGDSGLLGIGQDDDAPAGNHSGWTLDGYGTPSNGTGADFGLNVIIDAVAELTALPGRQSYLREYLNCSDETGDFTRATVQVGDDIGFYFVTDSRGSLWDLFFSFLGAPIALATGPFPTFASGTGGFFRACSQWPLGFGGFTFNFVAVAGVPGTKGSVHVSNEITLISLADPGCNWGVKDDGTYEAGYVVSIPSGSSDYFNNWMSCRGVPPGVNNITDMKVPVMDFGTTASAYPTSGVFDANYGVDASGWTPDLFAGYQVAPFTFPFGTFCTTAGQDVIRNFPDIPYASLGTQDDEHAVIQFPLGDPGLLGVGTDTNSTIVSGSGWTLDGYASPTNRFALRFGLRLGSN